MSFQAKATGQPAPDDSAPLPRLRPELEIWPGPPKDDGSPTFTLHDPVARTYDKLGWAEAMVLSRLQRSTSLNQLHAELLQQTTLRLDKEDIRRLIGQAVARGLTSQTRVRPVPQLMAAVNRLKLGPLVWLLRHYLYFRVPLLHPDTWLERFMPAFRLLSSAPALCLYGLGAVLGLILLLPRLGEYWYTLPAFFSLEGAVLYAAALAGLKILHEFSHALTAKSLGVRVPVMGLAFIILWPIAYTDVTGAWRLASRRKRLLIGLSGVISELLAAGWALLVWALTPPGALHSLCFVISSISLASTLLINLNPAMRFDGYYILMDLWGVDNLQPRSFAVARWAYRRALLGLAEPCPETKAGNQRLIGLTIYALFAWIYRLFLYLGIAVLVYYQVAKALGAVLFVMEIWWFILRPLASEFKALIKRLPQLRLNPALVLSVTLFAGLLFWAAWPLPRQV
jgi:putative peptide zinc metalloprotease protein